MLVADDRVARGGAAVAGDLGRGAVDDSGDDEVVAVPADEHLLPGILVWDGVADLVDADGGVLVVDPTGGTEHRRVGAVGDRV
jgi:hypothetical protein